MDKFTNGELSLLAEFLSVELEKGGNKYTEALLKLEEEVLLVLCDD